MREIYEVIKIESALDATEKKKEEKKGIALPIGLLSEGPF